jgi:hypothetical protein
VVILQVDVDGVGAIPSERHPPIAGDPDRPPTCAAQGVEVVAWQVRLLRLSGVVECPTFVLRLCAIEEFSNAHEFCNAVVTS